MLVQVGHADPDFGHCEHDFRYFLWAERAAIRATYRNERSLVKPELL